MKVGFVHLGCSKNLIDTEMTIKLLENKKFEIVNDVKQAEMIIVNTCGFIRAAKEEAINTILEMAEYKKKGKCKYLVAMGCLVQRYKQQLIEELPEVDLFISIDEYKQLPQLFNQLFKSETIYDRSVVIATPPHTAYLRIADGCSNRCTYCAIPLIRKDYKSEDMDTILKQAKELEQLNVKELNLIAQDTTRYGFDKDGKLHLAQLLSELNKMNFTWIRVLYMYPDEIDDNLLQVMSQLDKVVPYFDIPVQHSSNRLLKLMNRRGTREQIIDIVKKIRSMFKNAVLRTTIIVGFPTETDDDFLDLLDFVKEVRWDRLGGFTYSLEEDTAAYNIFPRVDEQIAKERLQKLMEVQNEISYQNNQRFIGQKLLAVVEGVDSIGRNRYIARSYQYAPDDIDGHIVIESDRELNVSDFVEVLITSADSYDLFGKRV